MIGVIINNGLVYINANEELEYPYFHCSQS